MRRNVLYKHMVLVPDAVLHRRTFLWLSPIERHLLALTKLNLEKWSKVNASVFHIMTFLDEALPLITTEAPSIP